MFNFDPESLDMQQFEILMKYKWQEYLASAPGILMYLRTCGALKNLNEKWLDKKAAIRTGIRNIG